MEFITTQNFSMPALGLGTYQLQGQEAVEIVKYALEIGYRHMDTSEMYGNEEQIGQAMREVNIPRSDIFLTSKVWPEHLQKEQFQAAVERSLRKLQLEHLDLLLIHWPNSEVPLSETLEALMSAQEEGKAKHIGISNFTIPLMQQAVEICGPGVLVNNQIEYHPFLWQDHVIQEGKKLDLAITAYRPLGKGKVFEEDTINDIAAKYDKNAAQVTLRWIIQQEIAAIPRSSQKSHVQENLAIFDFQLTEEEMSTLSNLRGNERLVSPVGIAPDWDEPELITS